MKKSFSAVFLLVAIFLLSLPLPAQAQDKVRVVVKAIYASNSFDGFEGDLKKVEDDIRFQFNYRGYRLISQQEMSIDFGKQGGLEIPDNRLIVLTPKGVAEKKIEMNLLVVEKEKKLLDTTFRLANKGTIYIGGPRYKDGMLLIAVTNTL